MEVRRAESGEGLFGALLFHVTILSLFLCTVVSTLAGNGTNDWIDGTGTTAAFKGLWGVAVDASGNILVADRGNHRVRRVTPSGGTRPSTRFG